MLTASFTLSNWTTILSQFSEILTNFAIFFSGVKRHYSFKEDKYKIDSPIEYDRPDAGVRPRKRDLAKKPFAEMTPDVTLEQEVFDPDKIEMILREQEWDRLKSESKDDMVCTQAIFTVYKV